MKNPPASVAHLDFVAGIPTLDLSHFTSAPLNRQAFVDDLGAAYRTIGFAAISGHGIPPEIIGSMYTEAESFFALPSAVKMQHEHPEHNRQRGFVSFGTEHAKRFQRCGPEGVLASWTDECPRRCRHEELPPNAEVEECLGLAAGRCALPKFGARGARHAEGHCTSPRVGRAVLRAICPRGKQHLRLIHYPPITSEPESSVRAGQHEDINLITLLVGASADGLEVMDKAGVWTAVKALPEHLVVNVGDMLQRLTNHELKSTTHRVVNPPKEKWGQPRFSMPFFCHPVPDMSLAALPQCVAAGETPLTLRQPRENISRAASRNRVDPKKVTPDGLSNLLAKRSVRFAKREALICWRRANKTTHL